MQNHINDRNSDLALTSWYGSEDVTPYTRYGGILEGTETLPYLF